jgi:Flp pilus assembly protein TadD
MARLFFALCVLAMAALSLSPGGADEVTLSVDLDEGAVVSNTTKVTALATSQAGIAEVVFEVDGEHARRDTSTPYTFDWDTIEYDDGEHTLTVKATDLEGRTCTEQRKAVVDNQIALGAPFHTQAAEKLLEEGKVTEAILAGRKAVKAGPEDSAAAGVLGRAYYKAGRLDDALTELDVAVELDPKDQATRRLLMRANVERAEKPLPSDEEYAQYMGEAIRHCRVLEEQELAVFQDRVDREPTPQNRYDLGRELIALGRYNEALTEFRKAVQAEPENIPYTNALALAMLLTGQPRQATSSLDSVIRRGKDTFLTHCIRALVFEDQEYFDKALASAKEAELKGGDDLFLPLLSAVLEMRTAGTLPSKAANDLIKGVLAAKPDCAEAHHFRAAMLSDYGQYYDALKENTKALILKPTLAEAYAERAIIYMRNNWAEQLEPYPCARGVYDVGLTVDPKNAYLLCGMAIAAAEDDDNRHALEYAKRAVEIAPEEPYVQIILAYGYTKNRYPQEARDAMEKARNLSHNELRYMSPPALSTLYLLCRKYGRSPIIIVPDETKGEPATGSGTP